MSMLLDWAKREVEIACEKENLYNCACLESTLKAFESLLEDGHSNHSIQITKGMLNRLIDGYPLSPIEDVEDVWEQIDSFPDEPIMYQCKRKSSLFKDVYSNDRIEYYDVDLCYCIDIHDMNNTYNIGLVRGIIHEMFPITMPYVPYKPIKVYCENFLTDQRNGDFDTIGIFEAIREVDGVQEQIRIDRFFRGPIEENGEEGPWVEISKEEYESRKARKI